MSLKTAAEITNNMYQVTYQLPESKLIKNNLPNKDEHQNELYPIIQKKL